MNQEHRRTTVDFVSSSTIAMSDHLKMTTTLDVVVVYDCSLSMSFYSKYLRRMIPSMLRKLFSSDQIDDIWMALVEFQSHHDPWTTRVKPFTSSLNEFQGWINAIETNGENFVDCKAIGKKRTGHSECTLFSIEYFSRCTQ